MINIQRNFYIDNIAKELPKISTSKIKKLPYSENIIYFDNKNKINIYFLDIDKFKSFDIFKKSIININPNQITFLIPISKNKKKVEKIEKTLFSLNNFIIINIYKLGVNKTIDFKREKIFSSYLTVDAQIEIADLLSRYLNMVIINDIRLLAIDLDNTLWSGILGEDGIKNIKLDLYQKKSLEILNELSKKGFLISLHSKNNEKQAMKAINSLFKNKTVRFYRCQRVPVSSPRPRSHMVHQQRPAIPRSGEDLQYIAARVLYRADGNPPGRAVSVPGAADVPRGGQCPEPESRQSPADRRKGRRRAPEPFSSVGRLLGEARSLSLSYFQGVKGSASL